MLNYLIMEDFAGDSVPFIFPPRVAHEDMRAQLPYGRIVSGGTVELGPNGLVCAGGCPELGISSRPEQDATLIGQNLA